MPLVLCFLKPDLYCVHTCPFLSSLNVLELTHGFLGLIVMPYLFFLSRILVDHCISVFPLLPYNHYNVLCYMTLCSFWNRSTIRSCFNFDSTSEAGGPDGVYFLHFIDEKVNQETVTCGRPYDWGLADSGLTDHTTFFLPHLPPQKCREVK